MTRLNDADLVATLTAALAAPPASPSPADRARLRLLLVDTEPVAPIIPLRTPRRNLASRVRHPVAAAAVVVILATSSAAAAAVGTDTLPGPLRTVAVSLGLPVPSPALNTARGAMATLAAALGYGDEGAIARDLTALQVALSKLDPADLASVKEAADQLVDRAELALASGPAKSGAESGRGVRGGSTQPRSVGGTPGDGRGGSGKGTSGDTGTSTSGSDANPGDGGSGGGPGPSGTQSGSTPGSSAGGGGPGPSASGGGSPGADGDTEGPSSPLQGTSGAPSDGGGASSSGSPGGSSDGAGSDGGGSSSTGSGTSGSGGGGSGGPGDSGGGPG